MFADYLELEPHELRSDLVIGDNQQGIKTVAGDPDAISYVSIGAALCAIEGGTSIRLLESDGVAPTLENVARDRFPIRRALHLVTAGQLSETAADFLEYARSPAVHDLVEGLGLVPVVH